MTRRDERMANTLPVQSGSPVRRSSFTVQTRSPQLIRRPNSVEPPKAQKIVRSDNGSLSSGLRGYGDTDNSIMSVAAQTQMLSVSGPFETTDMRKLPTPRRVSTQIGTFPDGNLDQVCFCDCTIQYQIQ